MKTIVSAMLMTLFLAGCAPKIYIIDRPTVLETEAGGDWPKLDLKRLKGVAAKGPVLLPNKNDGRNENEVILNAEN